MKSTKPIRDMNRCGLKIDGIISFCCWLLVSDSWINLINIWTNIKYKMIAISDQRLLDSYVHDINGRYRMIYRWLEAKIVQNHFKVTRHLKNSLNKQTTHCREAISPLMPVAHFSQDWRCFWKYPIAVSDWRVGGCNLPQTKVMRNCPIPDTPVKNRRAQNVGKFCAKDVAVMEQASRKAFMVNANLRPTLQSARIWNTTPFGRHLFCFLLTYQRCFPEDWHRRTFQTCTPC